MTKKDIIRKSFRLIPIYKVAYIILMLLALVAIGVVVVINPLMHKWIIESIEMADSSLFVKSIIFLVISKVIFGIVLPVYFYYSGWASRNTIKSIQDKLLDHLSKLPMTYYSNKGTGDVLAMFSSDLDCMSKMYDNDIYKTLEKLVTGVVGMIMLYTIDWRLAVYSTILGLLSIQMNKHYGKKFDKLGKKLQEQISKTTSIFLDFINGITTTRLYNYDLILKEKLEQAIDDENATKVSISFKKSLLTGTFNIFNGLSSFGVLLIGGIMIQNDTSDWGTVIAVWTLFWAIEDLFSHFPTQLANLSVTLAGVERILKVLDMPIETLDENRYLVNEHKNNKALSVKGLSFNYLNSNKILDNISFDLDNGELLMLAGKSGVGKSTLFKVLQGLYTPSEGEITFNMNKIDLEEIRDYFAYVPQEPTLFFGSVIENITCGKAVKREDVQFLCKELQIDQFISKLPEGYDTVLADNGASLSGGEKQRLAIARALVKDSEVLLLDEITANLDGENKTKIMEVVKKRCINKAIIMISHDDEIKRYANRIITI